MGEIIFLPPIYLEGQTEGSCYSAPSTCFILCKHRFTRGAKEGVALPALPTTAEEQYPLDKMKIYLYLSLKELNTSKSLCSCWP